MNETHKKKIKDRYEQSLQRGERFWPDSIYKDLLVSFAIFLVLILLATFVGIPGEPKADPSDSSYVPKPEWYFLFLFKFLAIYGQIPVIGKIEWLATALIPGLVILLLFVLPFIDRNPSRHYSRRITALTVMGIFITAVVVLTLIANVPTVSADGSSSLQTTFQFLSGLVIPGLAYAILLVLGLFAKKAAVLIGRIQIWTAGASALAMVALAVLVLVLAPPAAAAEEQAAGTLSEMIVLGQDLYSLHCAECHGADGEGGEVIGVEGYDGVVLDPINTSDVMYVFDDQSLANIIAYGQQVSDPAMPAFGLSYGGELGQSEIDYLVNFLRYTWDDRAELPADVAQASAVPALAEGEVPSYEVHISALVRRYCVTCHREGKLNNDYFMTSYQEILETGLNYPNLVAGDMNSILLQVVQGTEIRDPETDELLIHMMPPTKLMKDEYIQMLIRWVMAGMPETAAEAEALTP